MAHHGRDDRLAPEIRDAPQRTEQRGGDRGVRSLRKVPQPKEHAPDDESWTRAAEHAIEPAQDECALHFLADPAGEDRDRREERRATRREEEILQRVSR